MHVIAIQFHSLTVLAQAFDAFELANCGENDFRRLMCLNICSSVSGIVWEGLGDDVALLEEVCTKGRLEASNASSISQCALCLLAL